MKYIWRERKETATLMQYDASICTKHTISPFLAQFLYMRDIEQEDIEQYLYPQLRFLHTIEGWADFTEGVELLSKALLQGKKIAVWGDYDVDGVTSSALVHHIITAHGFTIHSHIPKREEGYGITKNGIKQLVDENIDLFITVDCGISDVEAIAYAKECGIQVIITDHHLPPATLPPADAICNPKLCKGVYSDFAGVGVAFIVMALVNRYLEPHTGKKVDMREVLDLVALGSIADLVPLYGQNRILVKNGLLFLKEAKRVGVRALKEVCGIHAKAPVTAGQVGFSLAPRINASGRIGHAKKAFELLISTNLEEARTIAEELNTLNAERKAEEERIIDEAKAQADLYKHASSLVLYDASWHHGVIGIIASRIVEISYKPTVILTQDADYLKGSARSILELDLHATLSDCKDLFLRFGGHKAAAGMSLTQENLIPFREQFEQAVVKRIGNNTYTPTLKLDGKLPFHFANSSTFKHDIASLQPFGIKNPEPSFLSPTLLLKEIKHFGENSVHATLILFDAESGITLQGKVWKDGHSFSIADMGRKITIAYSPTIEEYKGIPQIALKVKDWSWKDHA